MALVEVQSVTKSYLRRAGLKTEERTVVDDVSLEIEPGETLGLVGESGSGKTTVARMILGLVKPTSGTVRVGGVDVAVARGAEMKKLRLEMQPVFQDPYAALNPRMQVLEIVTEPFAIHKPGMGPNARHAEAVILLKQVGLDESALGRYPHEFSGGQRQRINIARALALRPKLLILDEPVSALDVSVGAQIVNLLRTLQREHGLTYLFISHSMPLVRYLSTRIAVMERGRLVEMGEAVALCEEPREAYTRQLLAATPELKEQGQGNRE
ncbi:ATP-binding cassette domain-containing protein [Terracidiphilus gabretensis]|uniref:ATP-binding cassette domain-containing protein n=1 Tax=Terracidiphilus gabretensis TaxID=1577687 RepID=UPI00071B53E1|nr:ATP-binding cassette domain-containing protein [Terracidiphilus gabretensis]